MISQSPGINYLLSKCITSYITTLEDFIDMPVVERSGTNWPCQQKHKVNF